jgi:hypothetical protein
MRVASALRRVPGILPNQVSAEIRARAATG